MKVAITPAYGPADVLEIGEAPTPTLGAHDVLVAVKASPVTAGDRRVRSADFPTVTVPIGRLAIGITAPRKPVQGSMFAGRVVEVGSSVTRYAVGDDVFGSTDGGAYAERLAVHEDGPLAVVPAGFSYEEAAAVPYGAVTALQFLRDLAQVQPGETVLVLGASGGVGRYAVQIAKKLGAEVTGVCSAGSVELVRRLGADNVLDYAERDFTRTGQKYDVIFDIADASSFTHSRGSLTPDGRYLTLYMSLGVLFHMATTALLGGRRALFTISMGTADDMAQIREWMAEGAVRPVVARSFPLELIVEAHRSAEEKVHGEVVVTLGAPEARREVG